MKKLTTQQQGFSVVEVMLIVVLVGLVGAVGYRAYTMRQQKASQSSESTVTKSEVKTVPVLSAAEAAPAPKVDTNSDLDTALKALDEVNPDGGAADDAQLATQSNF